MAGRPRNIDRNKVLDAAEAVVMKTGATSLSFETVAKEAGITKGGVQYCFSTKDNLIRSMFERWGRAFEQDVLARVSGEQTPRSLLRAHIEAVRDSAEAECSRSAALMTMALQQPDQMSAERDWYTGQFASLNLADACDRDAALALLAVEGAFMLRSFGLIALPPDDWNQLFADLLDRLSRSEPDPSTRAS